MIRMLRKTRVLLILLTVLAACGGQSAGEQTTSEVSEINILRKTTLSTIFNQTLDVDVADAGAIGANQEGFTTVDDQRYALFAILRGLVNSDPSEIEEGIRAIEYAFQYQEEDGHFSNTLDLDPLDAVEFEAFFLQAVGHSVLIIRESEYAEEFLPRIETLRSKLALALSWLSSADVQVQLAADDAEAPNRLVFDALAYTLNGIFLDNRELQDTGEEFVNRVLEMQWSNGVFPEKDGHDSSYQSVGILNLCWYWLWSENTDLNETILMALGTAADWEKSRINPETGEVDVTDNTRTGSCQEVGNDEECKEISYGEVVLSLAYWSVIGGDGEAFELAEKAFEYATETGTW